MKLGSIPENNTLILNTSIKHSSEYNCGVINAPIWNKVGVINAPIQKALNKKDESRTVLSISKNSILNKIHTLKVPSFKQLVKISPKLVDSDSIARLAYRAYHFPFFAYFGSAYAEQ